MEYIPSFRDSLQNRSEPTWRDDLYLEHHGIKGQKWGVRRPRNEDGIIQGAGKGLFGQMKARHQRNKEAKKEYKTNMEKAKKDLKDWGDKANAKYAKDKNYQRSGQFGKDAEKAVTKFNKAASSAKSKYKQTVNAEKIAKLERKRSKAQTAAGRHSSMLKRIAKQNVATRALMTPVSGAAKASQVYSQHKANSAQRRIDRLSN